VSGNRIQIESDVDGVIPRLVDAAGVVAEADLGAWALVGGLAVMLQLAKVHRATADVDTAADDDDGRVAAAIDVLIGDGRARRELDQLYVANGTKVDVIEVYSLDVSDLPDDDLDRVFLISHRWAVTTAVLTEIVVIDFAGEMITSATFPIATPASLTAMKLQSHQRTRRTDEKKASDVYDLYRLLGEHDHDRGGGISETLRTAPQDLTSWCADSIERSLVESAAHWARQLRVYSRGPGMTAVEAEDLSVVGTLAVERLRGIH
jgi:Nucleotidyl transferase AbiEii toxin, Type IV TA system